MKIAVLFFGQPRFVESKISSLSHKLWICPGNDVTFFGHMWLPNHDKYLETQRLGNYRPHPNTIEIVRRQYKHIKLQADQPLQHEQLVPIEWISNDHTTDKKYLFNTVSQLNSISRVLELARPTSQDFDLHVLTRWDNFIWWLPFRKKLDKDKLNVAWSLGLKNAEKYGIADLLMIGKFNFIAATNPLPLSKKFFSDLKNEDATVWKWRSFSNAPNAGKIAPQKYIISITVEIQIVFGISVAAQ
jgi:hypothetical protein